MCVKREENRLNLSSENKDFTTSEENCVRTKSKKRVKLDDTTYENDSGSYRLLSIFRFRDEFTSVRPRKTRQP